MIYIRSKRPIAERNGIAKQKGMITVAAEEKDKQEKELEEQDMTQQEAETPKEEAAGEPSAGAEEKAAKSDKKHKALGSSAPEERRKRTKRKKRTKRTKSRMP